MSRLHKTDSYVWDTSEELGRGATSFVYLARHKTTGKKYAVKTFTGNSRLNQALLDREIDVLRKLKHPNTVELFAIEWEKLSRHLKVPVLVMELCESGSLEDVLRLPENYFGLPEDEMLGMMSDLATGMEYLKDNGISHRDIKPGNMMRSTKNDGSCTYKLTDFGAARELRDNEQFFSLVGTPEYLHPDLYARVFIDERQRRFFSNKVDLWSIGVTLYHAAAGQLPFQPIHGRDGQKVMYHMTTRKDSGVISGVETKPGHIEWSSTLPQTCELSTGLQELLVPMIAGLEECDPDKMWTFEQFFERVKHIANLISVHIFDIVNWQTLRLYLPSSASVDTMIGAVHKQTGQSMSDSIVLHHGEHLNAGSKSSALAVGMLRPTEPSDPILLWSQEASKETSGILAIPDHLQIRALPLFQSLNEEVEIALEVGAVSCAVKRLLNKYRSQMALVNGAVAMLRSIHKSKSDHLRDRLVLLDKFMQSLLRRADDLRQIHGFFTSYSHSRSAFMPGEMKTKLHNLQKDISDFEETKLKLNTEEFFQTAEFHKAKGHMSIPWGCQWKKPCTDMSNWAGEAETLEREIQEVYETFVLRSKQMQQPLARISKSDNEIHKFQRLSLETLSKSVHATLTECLDKGVGPLLREARQFYRVAQRAEQELKQQHKLCASYRERGNQAELQLDYIVNQFFTTMHEAVESIKALEDDFAVAATAENKESQSKREEMAQLVLTRLESLHKEMSDTKSMVSKNNMDMRSRLEQPYLLHTIPRGRDDQGQGALPSLMMSLPPSVYLDREKERQQENEG